MSVKKPALGRGLDALFGSLSAGTLSPAPVRPLTFEPSRVEAESAAEIPNGNGWRPVAIFQLEPNPFQPRTAFDPVKLEELADSIREKGVLQPIIVRGGPDRFQIVAGERRWRAAQQAGLTDVPVVIKDFTDQEMTEAAIVENIQRDDLNPIDEARGYETLANQFGLTQELIAKTVGKSRVAVTNALRLLRLPETVIDMIRREELTAGHARCLLGLQEERDQIQLAREIHSKGLSVREAERRSRENPVPAGNGSDRPIALETTPPEPGIADTEERLALHIGLRVKIQRKSNTAGRIEVHYSSLDEFQRFCEKVGFDSQS